MEVLNAEQKNGYFKELTLNLQREGFAVSLEPDGLLTIELDGQRLCQITGSGGIRYRSEDVSGEVRDRALDLATDITGTTAEYMRLMELAPRLNADGLSGDYRLLVQFNGTVLAGHPTGFGVQFITWTQSDDQSSLYQGHYYGPGIGAGSYTAAKQDFAVRSELISHSALFPAEQMTEDAPSEQHQQGFQMERMV